MLLSLSLRLSVGHINLATPVYFAGARHRTPPPAPTRGYHTYEYRPLGLFHRHRAVISFVPAPQHISTRINHRYRIMVDSVVTISNRVATPD